MNSILKKIILSVFSVIVFTSNLNAQKVAVVLSGGGAEGLAHIGVLKCLEQNHIPIDFIAGTSMGALIGGLYAAGYSVSEIESYAKSEKFQQIAEGEIEEQYVYFFKKKYPDASLISFKFSPDTTIRQALPTHLVNPVPIDFALMELLAQATASSKNNFDSLMIPFRCVASDITNKTLKVFSEGDLGQSIRASISYPFYLKPVNINGNLFFDGGLYNNFPLDVADKSFSPDIIIGSTVSEKVKNPSEDDIISQIKSLAIDRKDTAKIKSEVIIIEPKTIGISTFNFAITKPIVNIGYDACDKKIDEILLKVKRREQAFDLDCKRYLFRHKSNRLIFNEIEISGLKKSQVKYVRRLLVRKNKLLLFEELKPRYFRLTADDKIKQIYPLALYQSNGYYKLNLHVKKEKSIFLSFGGNFSSRPINSAYVGAQYNILSTVATTIYANTYFGKLYGSYQLKVRNDFPFVWPFYTELSFTRNRYDFFKSSTTFFEDVKPSYLIQYENYGELNLAFPFKNKSRIILGGTYANIFDEYYQTKNFLSADTADRTTFNHYSLLFNFERNTLNKKQYANSGTYFSIKGRYIVGEEINDPGSTSALESGNSFSRQHTWYRIKYTFESYIKRKGKLRIGLFSEGVVSDQDFFNNYTSSMLASPFFSPIPEANTRFMTKFRAHNYVSFGLKNVINIFKTLDFRLEGYYFQPYKETLEDENRKVFYGEVFGKRYFMASSSLVYHSPVGPLSLALNYFDTEERLIKGKLKDAPVYGILFSFGYIIFNKRALE